tara:strand:- start:399 stop:644 length:246 start_codon:yes stop_codon:yes gene_type:complete
MDICLTNIDNKLNKAIIPSSVHGMLWLQTHFEDEQWNALSENRVIITELDAKLLCKDANSAGLNIQNMSEISILDVLPKTN